MGSNSFGNQFRITTWGESHGTSIGVVIDGCPAGLPLTQEEIQLELDKRRPGQSAHTSPRKELDFAEIHSGIFEGHTTGAPISIIIRNVDRDSSVYESVKTLLRPGHANFTYIQKYGIFDYRGGGRASARETACRVAAGAVAKKLLKQVDIGVAAYIHQIGNVVIDPMYAENYNQVRNSNDPLFCPDPQSSLLMREELDQVQAEGDSLGGIVGFLTTPLPVGLGDPVYEKLEANLAKAMLSLPASKGIEFGSGFQAASMRGSEHNDTFSYENETVTTTTNHAGGILGGISTGMPLLLRVAFKPTSSIAKAQSTLDDKNTSQIWQLPPGSRHDPCVAIRAVPVVEAMGALVLADALLQHQTSQLSFLASHLTT